MSFRDLFAKFAYVEGGSQGGAHTEEQSTRASLLTQRRGSPSDPRATERHSSHSKKEAGCPSDSWRYSEDRTRFARVNLLGDTGPVDG